MKFSELIIEGRKENFISKFSKKFSPEQLKRVVELITPKYLDWVGRVLDGVNFENNLLKLKTSLDKFDVISTNLAKTDINQYKSLDELLNAISEYDNRQRRVIKKVEGGNVVYEDDRYFVVNPLTHGSSCYYGKGTKWCTTADSDYQFKNYNQDGKLFYIIDKKLKTDDPYYKVALLRKFDDGSTWWDAKDIPFNKGWIFNTSEFETIMESIDDYMKTQFAEQLKIYADKAAAKKERERVERLRIQRRYDGLRNDAEIRKEDNEWDLNNPNIDEEGLKAHALLDWLIDNHDVEGMTNEDRIRLDEINAEIERLNNQYDESEDVRTDLLDMISDLEDERDELEGKITVYNIVPTGQHYNCTEFEVIDNPNVEGRRYAVGTEDEMQESSEEAVKQLVDDIGYDGFNKHFVEQHIDNDKVADYAYDVYSDDVRDNPEVYLDESERMLSSRQEEKIRILEDKISRSQDLISDMEESFGEGDDEELQEKIDETTDIISEMESEIEDIKSNPDGDFPDDLIEEKIDELVDEVKRNPEDFMSNFGLETENFIDEDEFIKAVVDADGYGHTINSYDGNADEVYVKDVLYYVMRID